MAMKSIRPIVAYQLAVIMLLLLVLTRPLHAWDPPESHAFPGSPVLPAMDWLQMAPLCYWMIHETWPTTWQDIIDEGFVTQPLYLPKSRIVNPDDRSWDFNGDIQYLFQNDNPPLIMSWTASTNTTVSLPANSATASCNDLLAGSPPELLAQFPEISSTDRQRQVMLMTLIKAGALRYIEAYDTAPDSYAELVAAGMSPLAVGTVNPLTGQPYAGLGEPNDFAFSCEVSPDGRISLGGIHALDGNGHKVWINSFI